MSVLSLCFKLANDLHMLWEATRRPRLHLMLSAHERELLQEAGGPRHWEYLDVPLSVISEFLFDKRQPVLFHDVSLVISRGVHARMRLTLCFRGEQVMEREYPEKLFHAAFRASGHVRAIEEVFTHVLETDGVDLKNAIRNLTNAHVEDVSPDAERSTWEEVWSDVEPIAPKELPPINVLTLFPSPRQAPTQHIETAISSSQKPSADKDAYVPPGPLRMAQVRLYAESLANGQGLSSGLSDDAREQILAYVECQRLACA
jgi:hypothetical protein